MPRKDRVIQSIVPTCTEVKSDGQIGQLRRKVVVSLDKNFIGKESAPLEEDATATSENLIIRSVERNLQPVVDIELEDTDALNQVFLKVKRGKRFNLQ